jgi:N-formylglutamate amidohydrolase
MQRDTAERMTTVFSFEAGHSPLVISIPHDGRLLMPGQSERMTEIGRALPDTDWHVRKLYDFASEIGASVVAANYSRYVVDLNRPADDAALYDGQVATGLCPARTFSGEEIYLAGESVSAEEQAVRIEQYWRPYHEQLNKALRGIRENFGYALLWDAHSIAAEVPLLFDGVLPDLNIGTDGGHSCLPELATAVAAVAESSVYTSVLNGRFRGGYITRHYGDPGHNIHALQLELAQRTYMDETTHEVDQEGASLLQSTIRSMLDTLQAGISA